jgi:dephospho-CoA kinase
MAKSLAVVGAIASGKSTAARWFASRGWTVVDADAEAHALYAPGSELVGRIRERFGGIALGDDGSVDRPALGKIVFADPQALSDLDALVHPLARERIGTAVERALERGEDVVLEMALLYRWPQMADRLGRVVGIRCADEIRVGRLVQRSALSRAEAVRRIRAQDQEQILSPATEIVDNGGTVRELEELLERSFPES